MLARKRTPGGFTYLVVLFAIAFIGIGLALLSEVWSQARQREKERELLYIGHQFREAIMQYYQRSPGTIKRYPEKLEHLLEDKRYLTMQRYLRRIYTDPMTGTAEWGMVAAPGGGIMGVHSLSGAAPLKTDNFDEADQAFAGAGKYSGWTFTYVPRPDAQPKR